MEEEGEEITPLLYSRTHHSLGSTPYAINDARRLLGRAKLQSNNKVEKRRKKQPIVPMTI